MPIRTAEMLRRDLKAAGIPYETDSGVADFHSLRGCYISYLVSSGASVKTCQTLARHSTPQMTIAIYAKASLHDINGAVEGLPDLTTPRPQPEALRMTGTDPVATRSATMPPEVVLGEPTQVECSQALGPCGGAADESDRVSASISTSTDSQMAQKNRKRPVVVTTGRRWRGFQVA
jgi:hypothetical protein